MNANSVLAQDRLNAMGGAGGPDGMRQALAGFKQIIDAQALVMTFSDLFFVFGVIMLVVIPLVLFLRPLPKGGPVAMH